LFSAKDFVELSAAKDWVELFDKSFSEPAWELEVWRDSFCIDWLSGWFSETMFELIGVVVW
jgi:hypothetical protein